MEAGSEWVGGGKETREEPRHSLVRGERTLWGGRSQLPSCLQMPAASCLRDELGCGSQGEKPEGPAQMFSRSIPPSILSPY